MTSNPEYPEPVPKRAFCVVGLDVFLSNNLTSSAPNNQKQIFKFRIFFSAPTLIMFQACSSSLVSTTTMHYKDIMHYKCNTLSLGNSGLWIESQRPIQFWRQNQMPIIAGFNQNNIKKNLLIRMVRFLIKSG